MIYNFKEYLNETKMSKICKTVVIDGFTILIGRNAEANDILTTEIAKPTDLWFHSSDGVPGSHVLIRVEEEYPTIEVIKKAAKLAAENSKGEGNIKVVYTEARNVTKPSSMKTGQVMVDYDKSKFITIHKN